MDTIAYTELTDLEQPVNLIGIVVSCQPDKLNNTHSSLTSLPGVEVHGQNAQGQLVVTIEELDGEKTLIKRYEAINQIPGILATSLVFSHSDDGLDVNQETRT